MYQGKYCLVVHSSTTNGPLLNCNNNKIIRKRKQEKGNKLTIMKNVIGYFSITTKPKVTIFDE